MKKIKVETPNVKMVGYQPTGKFTGKIVPPKGGTGEVLAKSWRIQK